MESKKLIGTIIGVIGFIALIAGATFAWLTITATVTNGTFTGGARNFVIAYTKGNDVSGLPILTVTDAASVAESGAKSITVTAKLNSSTNPPGNLTLKLIKSSDNGNFVSGGAIKYATKVGSGNMTAPQTVSNNTQTLVLSGTNTTTQKISSTTATSITVYFWLDAEHVSDSMVGKTYSGYVQASAAQLEG